ncbi:type II secretion system minor pseudopilin GspJ [Sinimarinibacterium thermocellulolyticum]|uniref:Type II secretion system protein J n=1 Tax=Sinimarinibacterium thermocellulolyticum TaxID=3170016 RepID=A0ABV2AE04_9GAMM
MTSPIDSYRSPRPRGTASGRHAGFTLLELVVVIAIFAVFSLMAYGGLDSVLKTRAQVEQAQARIAQMQKAYLRLRDDLQQIRHRPARDGFGDTQPAVRSGERGYLEFTRAGWRNPLRLPRPGLERVAYRFEDGELIRMSWRVLDLAQDSKPVETVLLDGIERMRWRYLDEAREWRDAWPAEILDRPETAAPPRAIELMLEVRDLGQVVYLFRIGTDFPVIPARYGSEAGNRTGGVTDIPGSGGANDAIAPADPSEFP